MLKMIAIITLMSSSTFAFNNMPSLGGLDSLRNAERIAVIQEVDKQCGVDVTALKRLGANGDTVNYSVKLSTGVKTMATIHLGRKALFLSGVEYVDVHCN